MPLLFPEKREINLFNSTTEKQELSSVLGSRLVGATILWESPTWPLSSGKYVDWELSGLALNLIKLGRGTQGRTEPYFMVYTHVEM